MAIVIRMSRQGRTNRPHFRIGVYDVRTRRDGPPIEHLGHYDPLVADDATKVTLNLERIQYWLSQGAAISDTVRSFIVARGVRPPVLKRRKKQRARRRAKAAVRAKAGTTAKAAKKS